MCSAKDVHLLWQRPVIVIWSVHIMDKGFPLTSDVSARRASLAAKKRSSFIVLAEKIVRYTAWLCEASLPEDHIQGACSGYGVVEVQLCFIWMKQT